MLIRIPTEVLKHCDTHARGVRRSGCTLQPSLVPLFLDQVNLALGIADRGSELSNGRDWIGHVETGLARFAALHLFGASSPPNEPGVPYASEVVAKEYSPPASAWALCAGLVGPKSRGTVRLASAKPADAPVVDARFLEQPDDIKALKVGIDLCRKLGNAAALKPWAKREVAPGRDLDDEGKANFIRDGATTFFHQVGTCRMGKDDAAVVDAKLRVRGVEGLRVSDGSIMLKISSCATMASCVFIAERMAEMLLGGESHSQL